MTVVVHAREAFFIAKADLTPKIVEKIKDKYTLRFYEEKACAKCEWHEERMATRTKHLDVCDNCAAFRGGVAMANDVKVGRNAYLSTPIGDAKGLKALLVKAGLDEFKLQKHFPVKKFSRPIKFTGTLKPGQDEAVEAILERKRGVLKAPPRSGKTVMSSAAICRIGRKTLIMASQRDWLVGFYETFVGSKTQIALTNASKAKIGFCRTYEDCLKYDICLMTVQTFYSEKGQRLLAKCKNLWSVVCVDEVHTAAASKYAGVLAKLNAEYLIGLSGTPSRKDMKFVIAANLIGPVIYDMKVERLRPSVRLVRTAYSKAYKGQPPWTTMVSSLEKDPARLKLIAQWAIKDARDGHMVLIPLTQVVPIKALIMAINKIAGQPMAYPFYGGAFGGRNKKNRDLTIERARRFKIKILVGNTKMLSTGINIPRASCIYDVALSSNLENCEQRVSRILTPFEGKPPPVLRIFLDDLGVRKNCLSNEWFNCIRPKFKPLIAAKDEETLKQYFRDKKKQFNQSEFF